jgi:hypothetical protein
MSVNSFIPELWSSRILERLRKTLVFESLCNRDYEGEIRNVGDTVRINAIGPITIGTYTKNSTTITPEILQDEQTVLTINRADYFAFYVDDVDARQASVNLLAAGMDEASYGLANSCDAYIASLATNAGHITSSTAVNSSNVLATVFTLAQALDESDVPTDNRWLVIPPWFKTKLLLAKVLVEPVAGEAFTNGRVGQVAGFTVYESNNLYNDGTDDYIMAGHPRAIAFANQLNKIEAYRDTQRFADVVRGLHLYGASVIMPDALAVCKAHAGAES